MLNTTNSSSIGSYFPTYISKGSLRSGIKNISNYITKHLSGDVVVPIPINYNTNGHVKFPVTVRSKYEDVLRETKATLMETKTPSDKLKEIIIERMGRKGQTVLDVCYDCCGHEIWADFGDFKKIAPDVLEPLAAWEYVFIPKGGKKTKISGLILELEKTKELYFSPGEEVSKIEEVTPEELRDLLYRQIDLLIPPEPPGNRYNLRWIADIVVDPKAIANRSWDFDPYNKSIRSIKRSKAEGVLAMPPSKNGITTNLLNLLKKYRK
jgi:hypothetical protein